MESENIAIQQIKVRNGQSWVSICEEARNQANMNISPPKILGISCTFCHYDKTGMIQVYYDRSIDETSQEVLDFEIVRNKGSWASHYPYVQQKINAIKQLNGKIIAINQLEINENHDECLSIIWFKRLK